MTLSFALARFGDCLCGVSLAYHRDANNRSVSCATAAHRVAQERLQARRTGAQHAVSPLHLIHRSRNRRRIGVRHAS